MHCQLLYSKKYAQKNNVKIRKHFSILAIKQCLVRLSSSNILQVTNSKTFEALFVHPPPEGGTPNMA